MANRINDGNVELVARVSVLEDQMERILGNGQPGMIAKLESKVDNVQGDVSSIRKVVDDSKIRLLMFVMAIIVAVMAAGSGTISLKTLIELFK